MFQVLYLDNIFLCGYVTFTFLLLIDQPVFILLNEECIQQKAQAQPLLPLQ